MQETGQASIIAIHSVTGTDSAFASGWGTLGREKNLDNSCQQSLECANLDLYYFVHIKTSRCALTKGERDMLFDIGVVW